MRARPALPARHSRAASRSRARPIKRRIDLVARDGMGLVGPVAPACPTAQAWRCAGDIARAMLVRAGVGIAPQRFDHIHVPELVQVGALAPEAHMHLIAALVVIVFRMQRLVHVGHEMDQEAQAPRRGHHRPACGWTGCAGRFRSAPPRSRRRAQSRLGVIAGAPKRNVHIVPGAGVAALVANLVGPVGLMHHHRRTAEQPRDLAARGGVSSCSAIAATISWPSAPQASACDGASSRPASARTLEAV